MDEEQIRQSEIARYTAMLNLVPDEVYMAALEYAIKEEALYELLRKYKVSFLQAIDAVCAAKRLNELDKLDNE